MQRQVKSCIHGNRCNLVHFASAVLQNQQAKFFGGCRWLITGRCVDKPILGSSSQFSYGSTRPSSLRA